MLTDQYILDLANELVIDSFAGGGGASTGIERAIGRHVDIAINHDREALGMHEVNHPQTRHLREDVFAVNPLAVTRGKPVAIYWQSPDCKHFSKAKGGKPLDKKIRGLALVMFNWVATVRPRVCLMENVEEIQTWGPLLRNGRPDPANKGRTWRAFLDILKGGISPDHPDLDFIHDAVKDYVTREQLCRGFGLDVECREIRAYVHGAPTIRKRLYLIARSDGRPIVWPEETHAPTDAAKVFSGARRIAPPAKARVSNIKVKPWRTAAECIDWNLPCPSIFLSRAEAKILRIKRPLVHASLARIAKGVDRYVLKAQKPFLVSVTHQGDDRVYSTDEPFRTVTGANRGEKALVAPVLAVNTTRHAANDVRKPLHVIATGGHHMLVAPVLGHAQQGGRVRSADAPLHTVCASPKDQNQLVAVHLTKFNTGSVGSGADQPVPTVVSASPAPGKRGAAATTLGLVTASVARSRSKPARQRKVGSLLKYYGTDQDPQMEEPLHAVTTKHRFGVAEADVVMPPLTEAEIAGARRVAIFLRSFGIEFEGEFATTADGSVLTDIGMRMLTPRELFRAQGFDSNYIIDRAIVTESNGTKCVIKLSKEAQIRMCGNSVCPPVATALVAANLPELCMAKAA